MAALPPSPSRRTVSLSSRTASSSLPVHTETLTSGGRLPDLRPRGSPAVVRAAARPHRASLACSIPDAYQICLVSAIFGAAQNRWPVLLPGRVVQYREVASLNLRRCATKVDQKVELTGGRWSTSVAENIGETLPEARHLPSTTLRLWVA